MTILILILDYALNPYTTFLEITLFPGLVGGFILKANSRQWKPNQILESTVANLPGLIFLHGK